jgi:heparan-alpha-glucosaminide N-acetyltransferase
VPEPKVSIRGWMGVSLWDMIQPSFMFMVGVAMPFSYARRSTMGSSSGRRLIHAIVRAIVLVLMGVFLSSINDAHTDWGFANVLCQIGLGYVFAYLFLSRSPRIQLAGIAVILFGYWGWFMLNPPPENFNYKTVEVSAENGEVFEGRFAPWSKNANAAHFFDVVFLNMLRTPGNLPDEPADTSDTVSDAPAQVPPEAVSERGLIRKWFFAATDPFEFNGGGYATLSFIPSIATTLLGVLCGQLLLSNETNSRKLMTLVVMGAACLGLGLLAHHSVCPIVKRIWTPSWVLFAGGYTTWALAAFFFLFDMLPLRKLAFPLVVVGMNSIAMYLMGQLMRSWVTDNVVKTHFGGVLNSMFGAEAISTNGVGAMVLPTATFVVFWLIAFWMYRNRYFIRV